jgi:hypothetical protein
VQELALNGDAGDDTLTGFHDGRQDTLTAGLSADICQGPARMAITSPAATTSRASKSAPEVTGPAAGGVGGHRLVRRLFERIVTSTVHRVQCQVACQTFDIDGTAHAGRGALVQARTSVACKRCWSHLAAEIAEATVGAQGPFRAGTRANLGLYILEYPC